jgi:hypothetical protein
MGGLSHRRAVRRLRQSCQKGDEKKEEQKTGL